MYRDIEKNTCFIVGHTRTGTTITAYSINLNPKAFIYGEADFFLDQPHHRKQFRSWYNKMHQTSGERATRGVYSFDLPVSTDCWSDHCRELLSRGFSVVGDKLGMPPRFVNLIPGAKSFFERHFLAGKYVMTFRPPVPTIISNQAMFSEHNIKDIKLSYANMIFCQVDMLCCFPNVHCLFFDDETEINAEGLFDFLELEYREEYNVFITGRAARDGDSELHADPDVVALDNVYTILREVVQKDRAALEKRSGRHNAPLGVLIKLGLDLLHAQRRDLRHLADPARAFA